MIGNQEAKFRFYLETESKKADSSRKHRDPKTLEKGTANLGSLSYCETGADECTSTPSRQGKLQKHKNG